MPFNYFRHYCQSSAYSCPIICKNDLSIIRLLFRFFPLRYNNQQVLLGVCFLRLHHLWLIDFGRIHWQNGGVKNDSENSSSFPFVYVAILTNKLFRLMCQLFYSSRVIKYFQNKWLKYLPWPFPSQYPCKNKCAKKGVIFVQNSIINCVYHKCCTNKMSTSLHAVFNVVFGNVYLYLFSTFVVEKCNFLKVVKIP